ncbi:MAG: hypothetical protein LQ340_002846 [Diploschistes diacapsis]|nr:MAG: hypothetical protein LQ340_002846 [Diploschistes diacapsis]
MSLVADEVIGIMAPVLVISVAVLIIGISFMCSARRIWRWSPRTRYVPASRRETEPLLPRYIRSIPPAAFRKKSKLSKPSLVIAVPSLSVDGDADDESISPSTTPAPRSPLSAEEFNANRLGRAPLMKVASVQSTTRKLPPGKRLRRCMLSLHFRAAADSNQTDNTNNESDIEEHYITLASDQAKRNSGHLGNFADPDEFKLYLGWRSKNTDQETLFEGPSTTD